MAKTTQNAALPDKFNYIILVFMLKKKKSKYTAPIKEFIFSIRITTVKPGPKGMKQRYKTTISKNYNNITILLSNKNQDRY